MALVVAKVVTAFVAVVNVSVSTGNYVVGVVAADEVGGRTAEDAVVKAMVMWLL